MPSDAIKELKAIETLLRCGNVNPVQIAARIKSLLPALEQQAMASEPRCGITIHSDEYGLIYGCSKREGHEGEHETLTDRRANPPTTPAPDALAHSCFVRAALNPKEGK
jgi:hypothetical protein